MAGIILTRINWIDWLTLIVLLYFVLDGMRIGFIRIAASILSYLGALFLSSYLHTYVSAFISAKFGLGNSWSNILGFLIPIIFVHIFFSYIFSVIFHKYLRKLSGSRVNSILGGIFSFIQTAAICSFIFMIIMALPLRGTIRQDISSSQIPALLVLIGKRYAGPLGEAVEQATKMAVNFLTVNPSSKESVRLDFSVIGSDLKIDFENETLMINKINEERIVSGIVPLNRDDNLAQVARSYSRKMMMEGFFSHYDLEGNDLKWRLQQAGLRYAKSGENLAYAPDLASAHKGLMESEGHRKNILDPVFSRVGVGIIDAGIYGRMFTQIFADDLSYFQHQ